MNADRFPVFLRLCAGAAVLCVAGALLALAAAFIGPAADATLPHASNFYIYTLARFEPVALYTSAAFLFAMALLLRRTDAAAAAPGLLASGAFPLAVAAIVLVAVSVGRFAIYQNFDLCIDEYLNDFEVRILDHGQLRAAVPAGWRDDAEAMRVPFENYNAASGTWASGFLPGFASLQWLASQAGADWAVSPVLAALSLLLLGDVARRLYPAAPWAAGVAVVLLAVSPQFLAMAMTKFAWTAQLCGTLLWVWLLTHPRRACFLLTPVLGALLIGLHQPHVHPLVAAPFVLRFLYTRQWKVFLWFAAWYLAGALAWFQVYELLRTNALAPGGDLSNLLAPSSSAIIPFILSVIFGTWHAATLLAWATPLAVPLLGIFLVAWREQPAAARDGFLGAALTFAFYLLFFPHPQGHGWGYRYLHVAYGLLILCATGGAVALARGSWNARLARALVATVVFSLAFQAAYRAYEIRAMVRPLARTWDFIAAQKTDFVVIETGDFYYAGDLVRNDPWLLQRPLVFNADYLTPQQLAELRARGTVTTIGAAEVKRFGVLLSDPGKPRAN